MTTRAPTSGPDTRPASPRRARAFPPPTGPRLDPAPPVEGPVGPGPETARGPSPPAAAPGAPPRPPDRVDWSAWQARIRADVGASGAPGRPVVTGSRPRRSRAAATVVAVGLLVSVGPAGWVLAGHRADGAGAARAVGAAVVRAPVSPVPLGLVGGVPTPEMPAPASTPAPEPAPAPPADPVTRRAYPVLQSTVDLVDPARPSVARGDAAAADGRLLRTVLRVPDVPGAGPFPLVVFAHGYATQTGAYDALLDDLASAGYAVAAPELPGTSTAYGDDVGAREPDEQVDDVRFVVSAVRDLAAEGGPLHGVVGDGPVAVIGHSDGGITAAAIAFGSQVRDARVGAAVVLSGAQGDFGGPWFPPGSPALLAVHGDADSVNPFAASQDLFAADRSGGPRFLVRVRGGGHTDAFLSLRTRPALVALVDDFLRAELGGDASAADRIPDDAGVPGVLDLVAG